MIDEKEIERAGFEPAAVRDGVVEFWYEGIPRLPGGRIRLDRFRNTKLRASFGGVDGAPAPDFQAAMIALTRCLRLKLGGLGDAVAAMDAAATRAAGYGGDTRSAYEPGKAWLEANGFAYEGPWTWTDGATVIKWDTERTHWTAQAATPVEARMAHYGFSPATPLEAIRDLHSSAGRKQHYASIAADAAHKSYTRVMP